MWWEIFPSAGMMLACLSLIPIINFGVAKIFLHGKPCARDWHFNKYDGLAYWRDLRITGSEYKPQGLEAIPDLD